MAEPFNPYQAWLGLENGRAPDHYELLGLPRFTADERQIAAAAERTATKVRSFRPGPQARAWSLLLDEIRDAKDCLCGAARKADYDERLRRGEPGADSSIVSARSETVARPNVNSEFYPPVRRVVAAPVSPAAVDPMAPVAIDPMAPVGLESMAPAEVGGLLPPGADVQEALVANAAPLSVSNAPSAARVAKQRGRQTRRLVMFVVVGCGGLIGAAAIMHALASRPADMAQADKAQAVIADSPPETAPKPRSVEVVKEAAPLTLPSAADVAEAPVSAPTPEPMAVTPAAARPTTPPESPKVTRAEVEALIKALDTAKAALGEQNFSVAEAELSKAESLAKLPRHQEAASRLREASRYVRQFRDAVAAAVGGMKAGETFKVGGSTQVSFIEGMKDRVVLRVAGGNKTYLFNDMPPGLALAIADFHLKPSDPISRVVKGAYLAVLKRADSETREKAKAMWQEAQAMGADVSELMPLLTDDYASLLKDSPAK